MANSLYNLLKSIADKQRDTGWRTLTLSSAFVLYGDTPVRYRRCGNVVNVIGRIKPKTATTFNTERKLMGTLPQGFTPIDYIGIVCQGSGVSLWLFEISLNREVSVSRYRNASGEYVQTTTTTWMPFNVIYITDDPFPT